MPNNPSGKKFMKNIKKSLGNDAPVCLLVCFFIIASIAFPLACAWKGHFLYRDIHLGTAVEFSKTSLTLANCRIIGFNATGTPTIQEFPIWQMLVGASLKILGPWWGWANVVSILIFITSLYPLYMIGNALMGRRGALWTLVFYLAQPLVFKYVGLASPDGSAVTATVWFCFLGYQLISSPTFSILLWSGALVAGVLTALLKLPFFMASGIGLFIFHLIINAKSVRNWISLATVGLLTGIVFLAWTNYTNRLQAGAVFPLVDLRISNPEMLWWYFGDLKYRLSPGPWIKGGWRVLNGLFGSFILFGLAILGIWKSRLLWLPICFILGGVVTTLIFTHLVLQHTHYYMMFAPAVAMLCASAFLWMKDYFVMNGRKEWIFVGIIGFLLSLSVIQGLIGLKITETFDPYNQRVAAIVEKFTAPTDKILIQGGGWGGDILTRSTRTGLSIWGTKILEDPANLKQLKDLGYNKLVMISESPLLNAIQVTNPGDVDRKRELYQANRTLIVDNWPVLYQTEDVVVQEIP